MVRGLRVATGRERVLRLGKQGQVAAPCAGFDLTEPQFTFDSLDLLPDVNLLAFFVYVLPTQAEYFTAPEALEEQEREGGIQGIAVGGFEEPPGFGGRPRSDRLTLPGGQLCQPGDVAHDQFFPHCPGNA